MPLAPAPPLAFPDADRRQLVALSRQRSIPRGSLLRVNVILGASEDGLITVWRGIYPRQ
jgi:hypothetical protein